MGRTYSFLFGDGALLGLLVLEVFEVIQELHFLLFSHVSHKFFFPLIILLLELHLLLIELLLVVFPILLHPYHKRLSFFSLSLVLFLSKFIFNLILVFFFLFNFLVLLCFLVQFLLSGQLQFFFVLVHPLNPLLVVNLLRQLSVQPVLGIQGLSQRNVDA